MFGDLVFLCDSSVCFMELFVVVCVDLKDWYVVVGIFDLICEFDGNLCFFIMC